MNNIMYKFLGCLTGVLMVFGLSGNVAADNGCESLQTNFTSKIGSQTSCADHNMNGCVVGSGESGCTYAGEGCNFEVAVSPSLGTVDSTTFSVVGSGCQVRMAITQGNQGANYCMNTYFGGVTGDTLTTLGGKNLDTPVSHKQLEVCTDELFAGEPRLSIEKTVVRVVDGEYNCADATDSIEVIAPTDVAYCYTMSNDGAGAIDDLLIEDDGGTLEPFTLLGDGTGLAGGSTLIVDSGPITVTSAEQVVNTATVSGTYRGSECSDCTDSDTATVNVVVACDDTTQSIANTTGTVIETRSVAGTTRCSPARDNIGTQSVGLLCNGACELRDECKNSPSSCKQPCKPSKNWTYVDETGACFYAEPGPGKKPLCQEVLGNPSNNNDCNLIKNPSFVRSDGHSAAFSYNPTLYYFPSSGGGDSTGTIYCILHPGETASVCPRGAFVY